MNNIGEKLKEIRKRKKLTQEELANKIGVTKYAIAKYEQGQREPKLDIIMKLADELEIDLWEMISMKDIELEPVKVGLSEEKIEIDNICNRMKIKQQLGSWYGNLKNLYILNGLVGREKSDYIHEKLGNLEFQEYNKRSKIYGENSEDAYINVRDFRKDFYNDLERAIDFLVDLKIREAEDNINKY